jgi:hypothetical protein
MPDLVDTLRAQAADIGQRGINGWGNTMTSAADRIEALEAEVERLRAQLRLANIDAINAQTELARYEGMGDEARECVGL